MKAKRLTLVNPLPPVILLPERRRSLRDSHNHGAVSVRVLLVSLEFSETSLQLLLRHSPQRFFVHAPSTLTGNADIIKLRHSFRSLIASCFCVRLYFLPV